MNITKRDMSKKHVFLAGSIGANADLTALCHDWQNDITHFFNMHDWGVFNPRRSDWNSEWKQDFNNPQFFQQVMWELNSLDNADFIVFNILPETLSPITLYEFGRYSTSGKIAVVCPDGFWRKGNIDIACYKDGIPLFDTIDDFKKYFIQNIVNQK